MSDEAPLRFGGDAQEGTLAVENSLLRSCFALLLTCPEGPSPQMRITWPKP